MKRTSTMSLDRSISKTRAWPTYRRLQSTPLSPTSTLPRKMTTFFFEQEPSQQGRKFTRSGKAYTVTQVSSKKTLLKKTKQPSFETCLKSMTLHQAIACRKAEQFSNDLKGVAGKINRFHNIDRDALKIHKIRFKPKLKISKKKKCFFLRQ